ncbi:MAG: enoyl-CoA hydratase/isomerase family protein [Sphingobium sp.]
MIDTLEAERFGPLGDRPLWLTDACAPGAAVEAEAMATHSQAVIIGLDPTGRLPAVDPAPFDALLTTASAPPRPWVAVPASRWEDRLARIAAIVAAAPVAACTAMRVLRIEETLSFGDAIHLESLGYSALLGGAAFHRWRHDHARGAPVAHPSTAFVEIAREDDHVTIDLARPDRRNGMCAGMRDALFDALAAVLDDPSRPTVCLSGRGACFSTGGDLDEFGTASDLANAHAIRTARSCALLLHRLGERAQVLLHGACIGSGIEIAAAAPHRIGRTGVFFQLPELTMGLMPGAGGTVTLPRAIGRHRTAAMLLTGRRIDGATALAWGLLTALEAA